MIDDIIRDMKAIRDSKWKREKYCTCKPRLICGQLVVTIDGMKNCPVHGWSYEAMSKSIEIEIR